MDQHYYTENPTSPIKEKVFSHTIHSSTLNFTSVSGVFSFGQKIDKASELLIQNFKPSGESVLDLGCGYGAIGLFIKSFYTGLKVTLTDINSRAVHYASINASLNKLDVTVLKSDLYSALSEKSFDDIVSNPPIAAGKALNTQLIEQSQRYLKDGGSLWLVAFHNKGGETLRKIMHSAFGNSEDVVKSGGIRVYRSISGFKQA